MLARVPLGRIVASISSPAHRENPRESRGSSLPLVIWLYTKHPEMPKDDARDHGCGYCTLNCAIWEEVQAQITVSNVALVSFTESVTVGATSSSHDNTDL